MSVEYEAVFTNISRETMHRRLKNIGAEIRRPQFLQRRLVFDLPKGNEIEGGWLRLRDEGDQVTLTLKVVSGEAIGNRMETSIEVNSFDTARLLLHSIGCVERAYQENRREVWSLGDAQVSLDEWPFLEPFIEVEGADEEVVRKACAALGMEYSMALFCTVDELYARRYGIPSTLVNKETSRLVFDQANPFRQDAER